MLRIRFVVGLIALAMGGTQADAQWAIIQLTDDDLNKRFPQISGTNVVWEGWDGSSNNVFFYDGETISQLSNTSLNTVMYPQVSGSNVVWQMHDGNDLEVFFYDGNTVNQLTDNDYDDRYPEISGSNVVWYMHDGNDLEIFFYDGNTVSQLTDNDYNDGYTLAWPRISGSNIVWQAHVGGGLPQILLYDGETIAQISDGSAGQYALDPRISGSYVVWTGNDRVRLYDGNSVTDITGTSTKPDYPEILGSRVSWWNDAPDDHELFFYNGSTTTQLTDNGFDDWPARVSASHIVWYADDVDPPYDGEIYVYDGGTTTRLTFNDGDDWLPQVSGSTLVWSGVVVDHHEIFMAVPGDCFRLGDINGDGLVDATDIPLFIRVKLGSPDPGANEACADYGSGTLDGDVAEFVADLLE